VTLLGLGWFFKREVKEEVSSAAAELGALTMSHESVRAEACRRVDHDTSTDLAQN